MSCAESGRRIGTVVLCLLLWALPFHRNIFASTVEKLFNEAIACVDRGEYDQAIRYFRRAIRKNRNIPQIYNALGIALLKKTGSFRVAKRAFDKAIQLNSNYPEPHFNMGTYFAGTAHDSILAMEQFEKAIQADPSFAKGYMGLGWLYIQKEDGRNALENFSKAVELNPELADAQYGLGMAYIALKKPEMVLKPITILRGMNRYDLAQALEELIQDKTPEPSEKKEEVAEGDGGGPPPPGGSLGLGFFGL